MEAEGWRVVEGEGGGGWRVEGWRVRVEAEGWRVEAEGWRLKGECESLDEGQGEVQGQDED